MSRPENDMDISKQPEDCRESAYLSESAPDKHDLPTTKISLNQGQHVQDDANEGQGRHEVYEPRQNLRFRSRRSTSNSRRGSSRGLAKCFSRLNTFFRGK